MKIAIFATNITWLQADIDAIQRAGHEGQLWVNTPNPQINIMNVSRLMDWCDVAYFDWCQYPFIEACSLERAKCKIVVRARGMPFFSIYKQFPWNVVTLVVGHQLIGQRLEEIGSDVQFLHLPQGTNPRFFTMPKRRKYGKNLGMHSTTIRYRKRVYTSIQSFFDLLQHDNAWRFHIGGEWDRGFGPGWEGKHYTEPCRELVEDLGISTKIFLVGNLPRDEWRAWLHGKDVFLSNGIREGTHVSLVEAMMCGCYPLINCWRGAENYYPKENVFKTQRELVDKILEWQNLKVKEKRKLSQDMRDWALERYDAAEIADRMIQEIELL